MIEMEELIKRIDTLIGESEESIISDAMDFIKIKSVQGEPMQMFLPRISLQKEVTFTELTRRLPLNALKEQ